MARAEGHAMLRNSRDIKITTKDGDWGIGGLGCKVCTYSMANLREFSNKNGDRKKQITKQAKAPRLQAAKTRSRSHRLTVAHQPLAGQNGRSIRRSAYASLGAGGG